MCGDMGQNYTTADVISKYMCNSNGILCEYATDRGYCKVTACLSRDMKDVVTNNAIKI